MVYKLLFIVSLFLGITLSANEFENIKTFEANFTQSIVNSSKKEIKYFGKVFIKEPSKILWKYESPIVKNVFIVKNFAIIDEPELEQAIFTSLNNEINILKLLKNAKKNDLNTYQTTMNNVSYIINVENKKINSIKYVDELENKITIIFSKSSYNNEINDTLFKFIAPKDYDIIRK